ncbi:MAG: PIG-L family deacetylase [Acidobacteriota bacterium]
MPRVRDTAALILTVFVVLAGVPTHDDRRLGARAEPSSLAVGADTRLLIFAPHPDDEVLAAGGLIQQVREAGGTVHVVYLTSGDSYTDSARFEAHITAEGARPKPSDYRALGHQREKEARAALRTLGVGAWSLTFLGFPNGGLNRLTTTYWSERHPAFRSPYTRQARPALAERINTDTEYRGENLTVELAEIIGDFKPTITLVPRPEDQHADHCATWFFVADALHDVVRVNRRFRTDLVTYIVHYNNWGFQDEDPILKPPDDLDGGVSGWIVRSLSDSELTAKRHALNKFKSQMDVMGWFLDGFARRTEVFSRPAPPDVTLPLRTSVCDEFE